VISSDAFYSVIWGRYRSRFFPLRGLFLFLLFHDYCSVFFFSPSDTNFFPSGWGWTATSLFFLVSPLSVARLFHFFSFPKLLVAKAILSFRSHFLGSGWPAPDSEVFFPSWGPFFHLFGWFLLSYVVVLRFFLSALCLLATKRPISYHRQLASFCLSHLVLELSAGSEEDGRKATPPFPFADFSLVQAIGCPFLSETSIL